MSYFTRRRISILTKKASKVIYKLRDEGYTIRQIKKIAREKYNLDIMEKEVRCVAINIETRNIKYSDMDKKKILYLYHNYYDTHKLIEYLNMKYGYTFTYNSLRQLASENQVCKKSQNMYSVSKITRDDESKIISLYNSGYSSNEIANIYGYKTRNSILQKLKKFNITRRDCNELRNKNKSYAKFSLKEIDSEEKAYFVGLLLTDGYINNERGYIGLELTDRDVMDFLAEYINIEYKEILPTGKAKLNKYRITLYGRELLYEAQRLGIVYNKTYTTKGSSLSDNEMKYLNYILRGIIDGDGWIRKDGKEFFICSASLDFIKWCEKIMLYIGFENIKVSYIKNDFSGIYIIRTASLYNLEVLSQKIYDKPFGMMRKYDRLCKKDVQRL